LGYIEVMKTRILVNRCARAIRRGRVKLGTFQRHLSAQVDLQVTDSVDDIDRVVQDCWRDDVDLVLRVCDRIVVVDFGRKIAEGTPAEIQRNRDVIALYLGED